MSNATQNFLQTLQGLEAAAMKLSVPPLGQSYRQSADYLTLNGLQVVAFVCLEDYVRQRSLESLRGLFQAPLSFQQAPESLQSFLLQEWVKGLYAFLQKKDTGTRLETLMLEAVCFGSLSGSLPPTVSDYTFGRAQSNIPSQQVSELLTSFKVSGGWDALEEVSRRSGLLHLGKPLEIFSSVAEARHAAAHGFELDFKLSEFKALISSSIRLLAFSFDTCLSQAVFSFRKSIASNSVYDGINAREFYLRNIKYDSINNCWDVQVNGISVTTWNSGQYNSKFEKLRAKAPIAGETSLVINATGGLDDWLQPI